jgi:hypothetical protein
MKRSSILALGGALLVLALAPAAALAAKVTVRVEGATKTLQAAKTIQTSSGSITKFGAPAGACPSASALGALDTATHGKWKGTFNTSFNDFFITSVLGETPSSRTGYWGVWVDNTYATTGACEVKLHAGDQVLFAVDSVKKHEHPLGITAPAQAKAGTPFTLQAVSYSDKGKPSPQAGVSFSGVKGKTDKQGRLTVTLLSAKKASVTFTGNEKGYIRASATVKIS